MNSSTIAKKMVMKPAMMLILLSINYLINDICASSNHDVINHKDQDGDDLISVNKRGGGGGAHAGGGGEGAHSGGGGTDTAGAVIPAYAAAGGGNTPARNHHNTAGSLNKASVSRLAFCLLGLVDLLYV
uniref:dormancy-associated protein 2-like n=1 Tax=Erigeron canadensis TaxID=72917 RepID=UPI001CB9AA50|nr:dormancy-associated protein 2-like [Erigeron canadensis]